MAGSIKDAFGKKNIKPEMFRRGQNTLHLKAAARPVKGAAETDPESQKKEFEAEMEKQGVLLLQEGVNGKPAIINERQGGNEGTRWISNLLRNARNKSRSGQEKKKPCLSEEESRRKLAQELAHLDSVYGTGKKANPADKPAVPEKSYDLEVVGDISPGHAFKRLDKDTTPIIRQRNDGLRRQLVPESAEKTEELCIGLDFGTSCTKVVVGDKARGKAYAIPFVDKTGLGSYLLPSRVWISGEKYSLQNVGKPSRDLKLRLLGEQYSPEDFEHAAAFLGLVIRQVRGWILSQTQYAKAGIAWRLNLGLPAASYADSELESRFNALAVAAEAIADKTAAKPSRAEVQEICRRVRTTCLSESIEHYAIDTEDDVVPEISAQVYGFVQSEHYDPKGENVFMVIDVGAGTVDSSIFHVVKESGGKHGFVYYSNVVDKNGVVNLHRARVDWLRTAFAHHGLDGKAVQSLDLLSGFSDLLEAYPEKIEDYYEGILINFSTRKSNPDRLFFWERCWNQVFSKTVASIRNRKLTQAQLSHELPLFLCGGGARMNFYHDLIDRFNGNPSRSWGHVVQRPLTIPRDLQAAGLKREDYDRLAVAYGLSFLRLGKYIRPIQVPDLPPPDDYNPRHEYPAKEYT